jgi:tetratricopeptide (TPR) repeat protein
VIGDYEGAVEAYEFVVQIRPKDYVAYANLGDLYGFYLKNYPKSEQSFLAVINNDPEAINVYNQLATIYEYGFKEKIQEAENILLLGMKSNPKIAAFKILLAQYYERQGRKADALKYFEEALKLDSVNQSLQQDVLRLKSN